MLRVEVSAVKMKKLRKPNKIRRFRTLRAGAKSGGRRRRESADTGLDGDGAGAAARTVLKLNGDSV